MKLIKIFNYFIIMLFSQIVFAQNNPLIQVSTTPTSIASLRPDSPFTVNFSLFGNVSGTQTIQVNLPQELKYKGINFCSLNDKHPNCNINLVMPKPAKQELKITYTNTSGKLGFSVPAVVMPHTMANIESYESGQTISAFYVSTTSSSEPVEMCIFSTQTQNFQCQNAFAGSSGLPGNVKIYSGIQVHANGTKVALVDTANATIDDCPILTSPNSAGLLGQCSSVGSVPQKGQGGYLGFWQSNGTEYAYLGNSPSPYSQIGARVYVYSINNSQWNNPIQTFNPSYGDGLTSLAIANLPDGSPAILLGSSVQHTKSNAALNTYPINPNGQIGTSKLCKNSGWAGYNTGGAASNPNSQYLYIMGNNYAPNSKSPYQNMYSLLYEGSSLNSKGCLNDNPNNGNFWIHLTNGGNNPYGTGVMVLNDTVYGISSWNNGSNTSTIWVCPGSTSIYPCTSYQISGPGDTNYSPINITGTNITVQ